MPRAYLFVTFECGGNIPAGAGAGAPAAACVLTEPCLRHAVEQAGRASSRLPATLREDGSQDLIGGKEILSVARHGVAYVSVPHGAPSQESRLGRSPS
ncbi:MAG TPA: hypothetical protein VHG93_06365 [Longimicrobium sp.]|nr:hypothetical protein [Longimicrobium sp.]